FLYDNGVSWEPIARGYAGRGDCLNRPECVSQVGGGPIPPGRWKIGRPYDSKRVGKFALPLTPGEDTATHGRSAFRIHGDNRKLDNSASSGCIVLPRRVRERVARGPDKELIVQVALTYEGFLRSYGISVPKKDV
ncbi:MAG: hypothetical protein DI635_15475, partial [Pseudoxanthomonas suwonensis]